MGVVYKAQDTKLDRLVALKFLPPHLVRSETGKARFLQEAKAAAALNHPNVCTIYEIQDAGEPAKKTADKQPFIAMEYVEGKNLREIISEAVPVSAVHVIEYAIEIAKALQEAHQAGIIHRDIKSENIMVNTKGQVKVMDFGLAKLKGSVKLTKTSSTIGTLAYSSPEQLQGIEVDARSDLFSMGVVLYELLTGHLPFKGDYEAAIVYSILNEQPQPVSDLNPGVSEKFEQIVLKLLEKDPHRRHQNTKDLISDLKEIEHIKLSETKELIKPKVSNKKIH
ncbi:serine/threonine protein kinase [candidate division KSB1 bacterium]|nr:serine/threonine protein kinase [candidate division KSB1 bacterium]MBL7092476.1 serine/threonine protein kinase [candidate division KSB1 bacterium]